MMEDSWEGWEGDKLPFLFLLIVVVETVFLFIVERMYFPVSSKS